MKKNLLHAPLGVHAPQVRSFATTTLADGSTAQVFMPEVQDGYPKGNDDLMVVRIVSADGRYSWDSSYKLTLMDTSTDSQDREDSHGE